MDTTGETEERSPQMMLDGRRERGDARSKNLNEEDSQNRERWRLGAEKRRET